jgi:hypothetical protein
LAEWLQPHVVCRWIGNCRAVAAKHYFQVTDQHYDAAAKGEAAHFTAQSGAATPRNNSYDDCENEENLGELAKLRDMRDFRGISNSGGGIRTPDTRIMIPLL